MLKFVDNFLNQTTMYRVVLYYLSALLGISFILSFFKLVPTTPIELLTSTALLVSVCVITNEVFARVFNAPRNVESVYITALILSLIITPTLSTDYLSYLPFAIWAGVLSMASKYIFAYKKKHIFNPAGVAIVLTAMFIDGAATWWVGGNLYLAPFVVLGGAFIVRKIRRWDLVGSFVFASVITTMLGAFNSGGNVPNILLQTVLHSCVFFFAAVMITEPLTTPPSWPLRVMYGALVGVLFAPNIHLGSLYSTPELALVVGNIFSFAISPKIKSVMTLKRIEEVATDTYDFVFNPDRKFSFASGQYLEWTLGHEPTDQRGNRRCFTISSSPTEEDVRIGIKFYPNPSSFKKTLANMKAGNIIMASQLSGDFVMPKDKNKKLVFIAGGIGITPFRSMAKYLIDKNERRDIVLLYSNKKENEIAYRDIFDKAGEFGMKSVYTITDSGVREGWEGKIGFIDENMIKTEVPDFKDRIFYISGPHIMVTTFENVLKNMGVKRGQIKTDYFPGFA